MDPDELTIEDMIDALEELDDEELEELRGAVIEEIADRLNDPDQDEDDDE